MEFTTLIEERCSVRSFKPEHLPLHFKTRPITETVVYDHF